jgi:hypothetical protein
MPRVSLGELLFQLGHPPLGSSVELAVGAAGALQHTHEVGHVVIELNQPLAESGLGLEVFVTDEVVRSGQAGEREREPIRPQDVTIEEQRNTVDELIWRCCIARSADALDPARAGVRSPGRVL